MILLDTHVFLWMNLQPDRLSISTLNAIQRENHLGLAAISLWETAMLIQHDRVRIPDSSILEWFKVVLTPPKLRLLPLTPEIAACSGTLDMHGDPADRLIAATAIMLNCPLVTMDQRLRNFHKLKTIG